MCVCVCVWCAYATDCVPDPLPDPHRIQSGSKAIYPDPLFYHLSYSQEGHHFHSGSCATTYPHIILRRVEGVTVGKLLMAKRSATMLL